MITEKRKQGILQRLKEIAPGWADLIPQHRTADRYKDRDLAIWNCRCCIVGEAHGFKPDYSHEDQSEHCKKCSDFCCNLTKVLDSDAKDKPWENLDKFVGHFKRCHKK